MKDLTITPIVTPLRIIIRQAGTGDARLLHYLEKLSCAEPHWEEPMFRNLLKKEKVTGLIASIGIEHDIGFALTAQYKFYTEILYVAVKPKFQHQGVASRLIAKTVSRNDSKRFTAVVHEKNLNMQLLLKSMGFEANNYFSDYYPKSYPEKGDAIGFALRIK